MVMTPGMTAGRAVLGERQPTPFTFDLLALPNDVLYVSMTCSARPLSAHASFAIWSRRRMH